MPNRPDSALWPRNRKWVLAAGIAAAILPSSPPLPLPSLRPPPPPGRPPTCASPPPAKRRRESVRSAAAVSDGCIDSGSAADADDQPLVRRRATLVAVATALALGGGTDSRHR